MKKLLLTGVVLLGCLCSVLAQRNISGTITDDQGDPLIGASVLVKNTTVGTTTEVDGTFTLMVPDGLTVLIISYTGFESQEITLGVDNVLNIVMTEGVQLQEVVVTGLGIKREKKALGYGVSTISSGAIAARPESDVARLLRGRATGVDITSTSGLSGSGTNVIIRGFSSITGTNQPLFVVDGIPFSSSTNADRNFNNGGGTASSRFLDLDPNNIAEVSILKGLSATVLYGEAGRNGVILITTKSGSIDAQNANKKAEISVNQSVGFVDVANLPEYQNTYGVGFGGNFGWFFSNWGPAFDVRGTRGIGADGTIEHPLDQAQYTDDFPEYKGVRYPFKPYTALEDFWRTGVVSNTSINMSKAFAGGGFSASYSYLNDQGFTPKNDLKKHNFSLGANTTLSNGLRINGTFNFVTNERNIPTVAAGNGSGAGNSSIFGFLLFTPRNIDLLNLPYQSPVDGSMAYYRRGSAIENPLWTLNNAKENESIRRFFSTVSLGYDLNDHLSLNYRLGMDAFTQDQVRTVNRGGSVIPDGEFTTSQRVNSIVDQLFNLSYDYTLGDKFSLDGIVGINLRNDRLNRQFTTSTNQFVYGLFTQQNFINHNNFTDKFIENTLGVIGTATLGYSSYLFLNLQARNDITSTLEKANRSVLYPSGSLALVVTDAIKSLQNSKYINFLKLRVGYGTSAGYPNPYQTRNVLTTGTKVDLSPEGTVININSVSNRLGNANLTPEIHTETELGMEGRFLNNAIGVDLSLYNKQSRDLIVDLNLDPSTGYTNTTVNAAKLENKGVELGLNFTPLRKKLVWDLTLNFTKNISKVIKIADGVDQVLIDGFLDPGNYAIPGQPFGVFKGSYYQKSNDQRVVGADGQYIVANDLGLLGDPNPDYTMNLINNISFGGLSLDFNFGYVKGGDIYSLTTATMLARGNTKDTDIDRYIPLVLPGVTEGGAKNTLQGYIGDFYFNAFFFASEGAVFDGTHVRLRELGLSYELPKKLLAKSPFGAMLFRISGENLFFKAFNFPRYVNFDPEVLSLGGDTNGRGMEFTTGPTARKIGVNLNFTF